MALKQANTLAPSNVSASGFALADARYIGGHRVVASLAALYALHDWQLLHPDETDTSLALGQQWYVKGDGPYRLTNWEKRKTSDGWTKEQAGLGNVTDGAHVAVFHVYDTESNPPDSGTTDINKNDGDIVYLEKQKRFLMYNPSENRYYSNWSGQTQDGFHSNYPCSNKLYVLFANGQKPTLYTASDETHLLYPVTGTDNIQVMTNEEIDALFE